MDADKTLKTVDSLSSHLGSIYGLFLASLLGEFRVITTLSVNKLTPRAFAKIAFKSERETLSTMLSLLSHQLKDIENSLQGDAQEAFSEIMPDLLSKIKVAYQSQMAIDIASAKSDLLRFTLSALRNVNTKGSMSAAIIASQKSVTFKFVNRAGRRVNSESYIEVVTKYEIIKAIYYSFVILAEMKGVDSLLLSDGKIIKLEEVSKFAHPNAKAIPVQAVKSQVT